MAVDPAARASLELVAERWRAWSLERGSKDGAAYAEELLRILGGERDAGRITPDEAIGLFFDLGAYVEGTVPAIRWPEPAEG